MSAASGRDDDLRLQRAGFGASLIALFASSGTLVCCALPALLVAIGAGAALSTLVTAAPQLVWLSEHKVGLFGVAGVMLIAAGALQWRSRRAACPLEPSLRNACLRTRAASGRMYLVSIALYLVGAWFAFIQPWLAASQ